MVTLKKGHSKINTTIIAMKGNLDGFKTRFIAAQER